MSQPAKVLLLYAHPESQDSVANRVLLKPATQLSNVTVHDLYAHYPDFFIDIPHEQALLREHDVIVFQHPLYTYSCPALLKEWLDRVLSRGFASGPGGNQLAGKYWRSVITTGEPESAYRYDALNRYPMSDVLRPFELTAGMCRMHWLSPIIIYWARRQSVWRLACSSRSCGRPLMEGSDLMLAGVLFLFAAVAAVPLASRLGIGAVLGYLLAGIAIGPWGLGFISDVDEILHFSELGVVFLMFIIGLELNPSKLWQLRRSIFGVGAAQVLLSAALLAGLLILTDFSWPAAVVGGIGLAMSSTAMALQLMREKGMNRSESGQLGFSVLLFQDLAVIPALALVPLLAGSADEDFDWMKIGMKVLAFAGMLIGGRYLLRPVFRFIAASGVREVFTAATLLLVLGSALFMDALGLSMALGTFIAGVLLAESEYRHELETAIDPFKGLLLGLFFISVGMSLNLGVLYTHLLWVVASVVVLVAVKTLVLYLLARLYGLRSSERMQFAGVLSQGGEFAFVLFSTASSQRLFQGDQMALLLVTVTLSMMTTPMLMKLIDKWLSRQLNGPDEEDEMPWVEDDKPQVIVVGFGRFGQVIGRLLMANKMRITVLERDISAVNLMRKYGYKVYYGDATQVDLLRSAGAEAAESIVITCNEPEDTMKLVAICQQHFPHLHILARARGRVEAHELLQAGVTQFSRETFSSALELGRKTLVSLGMHPHQAQRAQLHFRRLDMRMLRELIPMHADTVQISRAREARRELEEIFQREMQQERRQLDGWDEFE